VLLNLYNSVWNSGVLPPSWSHSLVVPIQKSNKPSYLPSSYGPISITTNACKLMEKIIVRRLKWFIKYNNFFNTNQSGFGERRRVTDHILRLHDAVQKSLANKHHLLAIFIDLEKAYYMVNQNVLLLKLLNLSITGNMFQFIRSFLTNRTFQVRIGPCLSLIRRPENGTPQDSVLSPILFTIMVNGLLDLISSPSALYADGFCLWESGSNIKQLEHLCQKSLSKVNRWCNQSGFKISTSTTAAVLFTIKRKLEPIQLVFESTTVTLRKEYKYLEVIFQSNGLYHSHIQHVFDKCQKRLNVLRLLRGTSWGAAKSPLLTIYRDLIRSVIEYGMEAYYFFFSRLSLTPLFRAQSNALRLRTRAMSSTPITVFVCNTLATRCPFMLNTGCSVSDIKSTCSLSVITLVSL